MPTLNPGDNWYNAEPDLSNLPLCAQFEYYALRDRLPSEDTSYLIAQCTRVFNELEDSKTISRTMLEDLKRLDKETLVKISCLFWSLWRNRVQLLSQMGLADLEEMGLSSGD